MAHSTISHYLILKKLGEGAMGEVYLAEDSKFSRKVADDERSPWMKWLRTDPKLEPLRSDPRFADLVRRVGF